MLDLLPGVTPEVILRLYAGNPTPGEGLAYLLRRTFAECEESRRHCEHLVHLFEEPSAATVCHVDVYLTHSRWVGRQTWDRLWSLLPRRFEEITRLALREPLDATWGLAEAICEESRSLASRDREVAVALGHLAVAIAEAAPVGPLRDTARSELLALAHATLANAFRTSDMVSRAYDAMEVALGFLRRGEEGLLGLIPAVLSLKGSLEVTKKQYPAALVTLRTALGTCQNHQFLLRVRLLIQRASVHIYQNQYDLAEDDLHQVATILDPSRQPELWCYAKQYHLFIATEAGQWEKADLLVTEVEGQLREFGTEVHLIKLGWCKARLELNKGHFGEAESQYLKAREDFLHHQLAYNAALVTVELAQLLLEQGRLEEVKHYALETAAEFERQGVEPELIGAIALLERAVLAQRLTVQLLARIQRQLQRYEGASRR